MLRLTLCLFALACAQAVAGPIVLPSGPLYFDVRTAEQYSNSNDINNSLNPAKGGANEGNWGIVQVDSISIGNALTPAGWQIASLGPTFFTNSVGGAQILGIFYGVHNNPSIAGQPVTSFGGTMDLYYWDSNTQDVSAELSGGMSNLSKRGGALGSEYTGFTCQPNNANCTFLARFDFASGADPLSSVNTIYSPSASSIFDAYLRINLNAPGAWTDALNSNYFSLDPAQQACGPGNISCTSANDIRANGNFAQSTSGDWDISNTDIVSLRKDGALQSFVVPEPNALAITLLALAMMGMAGGRRRDS